MSKNRLAIFPWGAVPAVSRVLEQGAAKHGDDGDRPGWLDRDAATYAEKAMRHLVAHMAGAQRGEGAPINHEDGSEPHLVHAAADLMIAVALLERQREENR